MVLYKWRTWLVALLLVLLEGPHTFAQLEWDMVKDIVTSRLDQDPMARTLQEGIAQSYVYTYSPSGFSSRIGVSTPEFSGDIKRDEKDPGHSLTAQPEDNAERSPDVQPRFIGKFEEWYKGKGEDEEEKPPHIVISTHHGISSHDFDHHHSDHHNHHDHSHSYHGTPHAYPPVHHHVHPPPVYHYPHHHQQPVVKPIIIETGRGKGGGNKKKKGGKGSAAASVYTETVVVTKPQPVVLTHTVTHHTHTHPHPVYIPPSKPVYVKPSEIYVESSKPVYSTSHVHITTHTTIYSTTSHVYTHTTANTPYLTPSHIYIQEPHTEYVAVSVETQDHGWGWGWDLFGSKGKGSGYESGHVQVIGGSGQHHGAGKGQGQVVYVMERPHVTPQVVTTHVVVQQQVPLTTHLAHPSTSEVVFMERPAQTIKKGLEKVKETFKAFGDGIKGVGDRIAEGVHNIKSKFSFQSKGNEDSQYVLLQPQSTHSVLVVTSAAPQTVVIQKPVIQTTRPKPVVHTIATYQPMVSGKGGAYFKGHYKGYSSGRDKSKGGDPVVFLSGGGHGYDYGHGHH
ncbi:uncharacterized protein [Palaemon carinicauda]|uniref:uncharacterized protein n=1 Tax=Palaemon carinicauda TaxID=392227 RepID=UPI0035B5E161